MFQSSKTILCLAIATNLIKPLITQIPMPYYTNQFLYNSFLQPPQSLLSNISALPTNTEISEKANISAPLAPLPPIPMMPPAQIVVPGYPSPVCSDREGIQPTCPPCPPCVCKPSCTPAFFSYCSPCHKKCRCKPKRDYFEEEIAFPSPMLPPALLPPLFLVPNRDEGSDSSDDSSDK